MARKLAHYQKSARSRSPVEESIDGSGKEQLNRRAYLLIGGSAAAAFLGAQTGLAEVAADGSKSDAFATDFSEYAL